MIEALTRLLTGFESFVLGYFLVSNGFILVLLVLGSLELRRSAATVRLEQRWRVMRSEVVPRLSVLVPAHDEAATIADSVQALVTLAYPSLEVVVVNDGSGDATMEVLQQEFALTPVAPVIPHRLDSATVRGVHHSTRHDGLVVVDKDNGGKADALNAALDVATGELVCAVDADTLVEDDGLLKVVRPFLTHDDVLASGGTLRIANGSRVRAGRVVQPRAPRSLLAGVQVVEYLRAFLFGRLGWNRLGGNLIVSGAFGVFRRSSVIDVGGYDTTTVGEDMELVIRLRRRAVEEGRSGRVEFVPQPVAWTEAPTTVGVLGRQRDRWHRGLGEGLWRHRDCIGRPRYGSLGMVAMPVFLVLELLGPVIEALGAVGLLLGLVLGALDVRFAVAFFLAAYGFGLVLDAVALALDEVGTRRYRRVRDRLLLMVWSVVESIGYRQLTVWWRCRGLVMLVRRRGDWGSMARSGFDRAATDTAPEAPDAPEAAERDPA